MVCQPDGRRICVRTQGGLRPQPNERPEPNLRRFQGVCWWPFAPSAEKSAPPRQGLRPPGTAPKNLCTPQRNAGVVVQMAPGGGPGRARRQSVPPSVPPPLAGHFRSASDCACEPYGRSPSGPAKAPRGASPPGPAPGRIRQGPAGFPPHPALHTNPKRPCGPARLRFVGKALRAKKPHPVPRNKVKAQLPGSKEHMVCIPRHSKTLSHRAVYGVDSIAVQCLGLARLATRPRCIR